MSPKLFASFSVMRQNAVSDLMTAELCPNDVLQRQNFMHYL